MVIELENKKFYPIHFKNLKNNFILDLKSFKNLKICVLQPDYSTSGVDYQNYDPKRNLSAILPEAKIDHVFLNKLTTP